MIIFKTIRYKNFLSSGNSFTEIELNRNKSTLVVGQNGAGKSTMLDALSFALFGRPHRNINKSKLVNSINQKQCVVEVKFTIGQSNFHIIRGIKPTIFEIWKDGMMINQSSHANEYQKILESNILKLNHKSFHQVVVLGSSSFIPFMQLNAGNRRDVIEDLLDINIFSKMNVILREKNGILKEKMKKIGHDIELIKSKVDQQTKYIRDITALTEENRKEYEHRISGAQTSIDELQAKNSELSLGLDDAIKETEKRMDTLQDRRQGLLLRSQDAQTRISDVDTRISFFEENETCPVCDQALADGHKHSILSQCQEEKDRNKATLKSIGKEGTGVEEEITETSGILLSLRDKVSKLSENNREISSLQRNIADYRKYLDKDVSADLNTAKKELTDLNQNKENMFEEKLMVSEQFNYNGVIAEMLKDTGIKTKIIKQYLPAINKLVNQYLQVLDFYVQFDLDENFQETIRSRHRDDFIYESFSEGEKQRIDLSLLFTWRQIAKMKNSVATNLLMLDETFDSSLDHDGIENLLKILNMLDDDTNTFIISHKGDILDGKFESKIEFVKDRNFSKMKN
tara:strand:- start:3336 stop:5048 length:1713 start_codon:yes stop_codon:yes gene_type:complete